MKNSIIPLFIFALLAVSEYGYADICDRGASVREAIMAEIQGVPCEKITEAALASITKLYLGQRGKGLRCWPLQHRRGDYDGLVNLEVLSFTGCVGVYYFHREAFHDLKSLKKLTIPTKDLDCLPDIPNGVEVFLYGRNPSSFRKCK